MKIRLRYIAAAFVLIWLALAFWRELAEPSFNRVFNIHDAKVSQWLGKGLRGGNELGRPRSSQPQE